MNKRYAVITGNRSGALEAYSSLDRSGLKILQTYSPVQMTDFNNKKAKGIAAFAFIGGIVGLLIAIALIYGITNLEYRINVGGKPFFHPVYIIPIVFVLSVLFAAISTFAGFLYFSKLPDWSSDFEEFEELHESALKDKFIIVFEAQDSNDKGIIDNLLLTGLAERIVEI